MSDDDRKAAELALKLNKQPLTTTDALELWQKIHSTQKLAARLANILLANEQPPPIKNDAQPVWDAVIADMKERDRVGRERYGTPLQPFNGRDALADAYAECLDMAVYLKQAMIERDSSPTAEEYSDELRALCCELSVGGYNSAGLLTPKEAVARIRKGIEILLAPFTPPASASS